MEDFDQGQIQLYHAVAEGFAYGKDKEQICRELVERGWLKELIIQASDNYKREYDFTSTKRQLKGIKMTDSKSEDEFSLGRIILDAFSKLFMLLFPATIILILATFVDHVFGLGLLIGKALTWSKGPGTVLSKTWNTAKK